MNNKIFLLLAALFPASVLTAAETINLVPEQIPGKPKADFNAPSAGYGSSSVQAQLRRYKAYGGSHPAAEQKPDEIVNGGLTLDMRQKLLFVDGEAVRLTATEYKITELLMRHIGQVFSAAQIYENVWNENADFSVENTVMVHIRHIREKIEIDPKNPRYVKVVWGIGYKMEKHQK